MPPPISLRLTKRQRGLLPAIKSGVASGLSSRSINEAIRRATGTGMNRQVLLDVMREMQGIQKHGDTLKNVRLDRRPDITKVRTALTPIRRALSSTVKIGEAILATGERVDRFVQVAHNEVLTRGAIEDIARGFLESEPVQDSGEGLVLVDILLVEQIKRA